MKSKQRSKMQPKMGKLGMDYQMMHEAFFKYQSKPRMTRMGDLYYEGKEFEAKVGGAYCGCSALVSWYRAHGDARQHAAMPHSFSTRPLGQHALQSQTLALKGGNKAPLIHC